MKPHIITIVGKSNSGKTTLLEKIVKSLTLRGFRIGTAKHTHDGFDMDKKGKDSWRHQHAGAVSTLLVTDTRVALVKQDSSTKIEKLKTYLSDQDIIISEGFKNQDLAKIEIFRVDGPHENPLCMADKNLIAFVTDSDHRPQKHVPIFGLEEIEKISDFIEHSFIRCQE